MGNKYIYLITGASGSGKSTVANKLSQLYGFKVLDSYTTRAPRYKSEKGHIFVDQAGFDSIRDDLCAHTIYDGFEYGATNKQVDESDLYVIDWVGIKWLKKNYKGTRKPIVLYITADDKKCEERMAERGDKAPQIARRKDINEHMFPSEPVYPTLTVANNGAIEETIKTIMDFMNSISEKAEDII